jgi:adenine-specific DNA-methyltransferase
MANRLRLTKSLLKDDGIIIVAIDDYEIHTIRFLMDEIFQENNRLGSVTVVHNPRGRSDDKFFASSHEYMLIYSKNSSIAKTNKLKATEEQLDAFNKEDGISRYRELSFRRSGSNSRREDRPNLFYPVYFNSKTKEISFSPKKGYSKIIPLDTSGNERVWRWGQDTLFERYSSEIVIKERNGKFNIYTKDRIKEGRKPKSIWHNPKYDASSHGTILLQKILGRRNLFEYPKSIFTVLDILQVTTDESSIVLDFFAGSGTTAHSMMELNKIDNGSRQCILVTNNENDICKNVCYPRVSKIINGYVEPNSTKVQGYKDNLQFFKTSFVPAKSTDRNKEKLTKQSVEMLCLKENTFDSVLDLDNIKIFKNNDHYTGILFDEEEIPNFKEQIKDFELPVSVYVFSLGDDDFAEEFSDIKDKVKICSIPAAILRVYKRIFR